MGERERDRLLEFLRGSGARFTLLEHSPVRTSSEAAAERGVELRSGVKALVFRDVQNGRLVMVLIRGDRRVDLAKLKRALSSSDVRMANRKELLEATGCEPGSVHPFGNLFGLKVIMDSGFDVETVNFNAGTLTNSVNMALEEMVRLIGPSMADLAAPQ